MSLPRNDDGTLCAFAWPGGYPILYLDRSNSVLCPACAQKSMSDEDARFRPCGYFIHYEGPPEVCEQCSAEIESAYGDPALDE